MNAQELTAQINTTIERLASATDEARNQEDFVKYLDFASRFHKYSFHNQWLILWQKPEATFIAGYRAWQKMNRYVKKGEKGIAILAPCIYRKKDDQTGEETKDTAIYYKVVYVFDISQTGGEDPPSQPEWTSPARSQELFNRCKDLAASLGITVSETTYSDETQGIARAGEIDLATTAGTKTFIHELAHHILGHVNSFALDRKTEEVQAESTAYIVATHFNLPDLKSPNYIALKGGDSKDIKANMTVISKAARQLIDQLDPQDGDPENE